MTDEVARAYDEVAPGYDQAVAADAWVRRQLRDHYRRIFRPGQRVLDVGCGTGLDTLFLAGLGLHVTGLDVSAGMLEQLRASAKAAGLAKQIEVVEGDASVLADWRDRTFDGIISTFAVLNTVDDLSGFARSASDLLRPGARMLVHMLNRFSMWEWIALMQGGRFRDASRLGTVRERRFQVGSESIAHRLYSPEEAFRECFVERFRLVEAYGLGGLRPPPDRDVHRRLREAFTFMESRLRARWPLSACGRFFVLDLERR